MTDPSGLIIAAMSLREQAPESWDSFVRQMGAYSSQMTANMVRCEPSMLPRAQGMAIAAVELYTTLKEAPNIYAKMREKR